MPYTVNKVKVLENNEFYNLKLFYNAVEPNQINVYSRFEFREFEVDHTN